MTLRDPVQYIPWLLMSVVTASTIPKTRLLKVSKITSAIKAANMDTVKIVLQEDMETDMIEDMVFVIILKFQICSQACTLNKTQEPMFQIHIQQWLTLITPLLFLIKPML